MPSGSQNADLNTLLRWATENTPARQTPRTGSTAVAPVPDDPSRPDPPAAATEDAIAQPLGLTFRPAPGSDLSVVETPQPEPERKKFDTGVLDAIMGRTDAVRIREAMAVFEDENKGIDERETAGDELEDLIEDLDNANDLESLGMWPRLLALLSSPHEIVRFYTAWICGTAVQNNPKAQAAMLKRDPLPAVLALISPAQSEEMQSKAMYCLSSLLKHAPASALNSFAESGGWAILENCLRGPSLNLRRKTAFLLNNLALQSTASPRLPAQISTDGNEGVPLLRVLQSSGIYTTLVESLSPSRSVPTGLDGDAAAQDEDYIDKALRAVTTILTLASPLDPSLPPDSKLDEPAKRLTRQVVEELKSAGEEAWKARLVGAGVAAGEWKEAEAVLAA